MSLNLEAAWSAPADTNRRYWRVYLSETAVEKGELVKQLDGDADLYLIPDLDEAEYWVSVLSVSLGGTEQSWKTATRGYKDLSGQDHKPGAPAKAGGAAVDGSLGLKVVVDPPGAGDPPQKVQVIKGDSEFVGQLVGEVDLDPGGVTDGAGMRAPSFALDALPGRGTGNGTQTWTLRGVSKDGHAPGTSATFGSPYLGMANHSPTVLASVVGATLTGFSAALETQPYEFVAADGLRLRELPSASGATAAWGTSGSTGTLGREASGAYYVTGATIYSQELDVGSVKTFALECYDECQRASPEGIFSSMKSRDFAEPSGPAYVREHRIKSIGPTWAGHEVRSDGKCLRPVIRPRWQFRFADTSPLTGLSWQEYVPGAKIRGRYVQTALRVDEPLGLHQVRSPRIYVRAWQPTNSQILTTSGADFQPADLSDLSSSPEILQLGVRTDTHEIQFNVGGTVFTVAGVTA